MFDRGAELGIVVVHHRTPQDLLADALARLRAAAPSARVVLVDTAGGPAADTVSVGPSNWETVQVPNHSYSHAVNSGLERLSEPYLVVMNADVLVEHDTFDRLLSAMRADPQAGIVGPLALTPDGRPQDLGLPYRLAYAAAARSGAAGARVSWLSGCLQLIDRGLYEAIGGYDDSLRFFNEDLEYCLRARRAGRICRLVAAPVVHVGGASTPAHPAFHVEGRRGGYLLTQRYRSPAFAFLHRGFLRMEALLGAWSARDEPTRDSHRAMKRLLASGDWQRSPFGATLDDR